MLDQPRVLVACEFTGTVRRAFRALGADAVSCDLLPAEDDGPHIQGDVREVLDDGWDLIIAHPPCTYLCNSGVRWLHERPGRWKKMVDAAVFFRQLLEAPAPHIAVENPVMHGYARKIVGRGPDQSIQPYEFGHDASKRTCLWLKDLPLLEATCHVEPGPDGTYANQTPSGQNKLGPSDQRGQDRARTYRGIAWAMAETWFPVVAQGNDSEEVTA